MTTANDTISENPHRSVTTILSDCETQTDLLRSTARLLDHLQSSEQTIQGADLEPLQFVIERAAGALASLHNEALAAIGGGAP